MNYLPTIYTDKEYDHVTEEEGRRVWVSAKVPYVRLFIKTIWFTDQRSPRHQDKRFNASCSKVIA